MSLKKRPIDPSKSIHLSDPWIDPEFHTEFPALHAFLYDTTYEDGTQRITGGLVVFVKYNVLTVAVNDNDRNVVAYVNAPTWAELLFKLNEGICNDSLDWKSRRPAAPSKEPPY